MFRPLQRRSSYQGMFLLIMLLVIVLSFLPASSQYRPTRTLDLGEQASVQEVGSLSTDSFHTLGAQIWLAPFAYGTPAPAWQAGYGVRDFMELFKSSKPWRTAARSTNVFLLHVAWVHAASYEDLRAAVTFLKEQGIAIALEVPPLTSSDTCGWGIEGFHPDPVAYTMHALSRIDQIGGAVSYLAMDEPLTFGTLFAGAGACRWSPERVAFEVASYVEEIKRSYPNILIGGNESDRVQPEMVKEWLRLTHAATGVPLAFLHWDVDWSGSIDWAPRVKAIQDIARANGVRFGVLYNGNATDPDQETWIKNADSHIATFEGVAGGRPDDSVFQSWHNYPHTMLPETEPHTFTWLLRRYVTSRPTLSVQAGWSASTDGSLEISGKLSELKESLGGNTLLIEARPLDGMGLYQSIVVEGTVPASAHGALLAIRANAETSGRAQLDISVCQAELEFFQEGSGIPDVVFAPDIESWSFAGSATYSQESDGSGTSSCTRVQAGPEQSALMNSPVVPLTPGSRFVARFMARVSPSSVGGGYFSIIFNSSAHKEISRARSPFAVAEIYGNAITDSIGRFQYQMEGLPTGNVFVEVMFPGSQESRPVYASTTVSDVEQ